MESQGTSDATKLLETGESFGGYTIVKLLGKGGMGAVYLVRAPDGELYAMKVMYSNAAREKHDFLKRFLREAEFALQIRHPNLIPVHRVGKDEATGSCYLVMDYMPGGSLTDRLHKCRRLSVEEAISIVVQVAGALEVAHRHGVIHRDIKPDNIMFDADGTPKLADLGVAKFTDEAHKTTVTTTGMIIGTPAYMAPEQMMNAHTVDARADIYSLGVVFYEMLAGCRPHEDSTAVELMAKAIKGEPLPDVRTLRPEVSAALAYVLSLMCAPKPEGRPPSPHAVVELFQKASDGTLDVPERSADEDAARRMRGRKLLLAILSATLLLALGAVGTMAVKGMLASRSKGDRQIIVVTNTVNHVTSVANHSGAPEKMPGEPGGNIAVGNADAGKVEQSSSTNGIGKVMNATPKKNNNRNKSSRPVPIRQTKKGEAASAKSVTATGQGRSQTAFGHGAGSGNQGTRGATGGQPSPGHSSNEMPITAELPPDSRRRMVVMPFRPLADKVDVFGRDFQVGTACEAIAGRINDELLLTRRFTMQNQTFSADVLAELNRLNLENATPRDIGRVQQLLVTDYMVVGTVKMYSSPKASYNQWTGVTTQNDGPFLEIAYRVCLVPSNQLKWAGTVVVPYSACRGNSVETALESGMSVAAREVSHDIVDNIYPMRVTAKTSSELVISAGGKDVRVGEMFDVYRQGETIVDINTGEALGAPEEKIAVIQIARVDPKVSYAVVAEGTPLGLIPVGVVLRRQKSTQRTVPFGSATPVQETVVPPWKKQPKIKW